MSVTSGDCGPVLVLSGESDVSTAAELTAALTMQVAAGVRYLTIDLSGLGFADSASIQAFVQADRAFKARGGAMELVAPQPTVARVLSLLGVDQFITVRPRAAARALEDTSGGTAEPGGSRQSDAGPQAASG